MSDVDYDKLTEAFEYQRLSSANRHTNSIYVLCLQDYLRFSTDTVSVYIDQEWVDCHEHARYKSGNESQRHIKYKLIAAKYLEQRGHSLDRISDDDESTAGRGWKYDCFEERVGDLNTDVVCSCRQDTTAVEVGYVSAEQVLSGFGYCRLGRSRTAEELIENTVRVHKSDVDTVITIPYFQSSDDSGEVTVYRFEKTDKMPDADPTILKSRAEDVLYGSGE